MDLLLVFATALTFYCATLAPTLIWGDSAWFTLYAKLNVINFGTASDHPLYLEIGRLFTSLPGDPARNLAFESAIFGALAVMLVYRIARQIGTSRLAAILGAGALCVSHAFWMHAVIPEVYTAHVFFLLTTLSLLIEWGQRQRWYYLAAALTAFAIGMTNHLVLASVLPAIAAYVVVTRPRAFLAPWVMAATGAALVIVAGLALFPPAPLASAAHRIWVGPPGISDYFRLDMRIWLMVREAGFYLLYLAYQFPSITLLLGLLGIRAVVRDNGRVATLLLLAIGVNAGVFIHHTAWDSAGSAKFVFYIADYSIFAILCAVGADEVVRLISHAWERPASRRWAGAMIAVSVIMPPAIYAAIPAVANVYGLDLVGAKTVPYRNNQTYFLNPNKHGYDGARRFGEEALRSVPPSSVIFADYTPFAVLRYLQLVEQVRPDVLLRFPNDGARVPVQWVVSEGRRRPTYIATLATDYYDFTGLTGEYDLVPAGPIIEVRPRD